MLQQPTMLIKEISKIISKELGIGQRTVQSTISEYKKSKTVSSPNKTKIRSTFKEKVDDFERNAIRRKIHNFWFAVVSVGQLRSLSVRREGEIGPRRSLDCQSVCADAARSLAGQNIISSAAVLHLVEKQTHHYPLVTVETTMFRYVLPVTVFSSKKNGP